MAEEIRTYDQSMKYYNALKNVIDKPYNHVKLGRLQGKSEKSKKL